MRIDAPVDRQGLDAGKLHPRISRPGDPDAGAGDSLNTVAVRLASRSGRRRWCAPRIGSASPRRSRPNASIALGTSEVSLLELTGAYAPFANGGHGASARMWSAHPHGRRQGALSSAPADRLGQVVGTRARRHDERHDARDAVTGTGAQGGDFAGWPAAGKTGTSQDFRDAWFVGYTANLVTGVWLGNDDNSPTKKATGGGLPAEIWTRFMTAAHHGVPVAALPNRAAAAPSNFLSNFF